jgi:uncharacterized protein (DUF302 family)
MKYHHSKTIKGTNIQTIRPKVEEALKAEGFGILTEIDIQATMKKKLDKDYLPHIILGACNPVYADKVLSIEPNISTLLPCNVCLRELEDGGVEVSAINPLEAMKVVDNPAIEGHGKEINEMLKKVIDQL